MQTNPSNSLSNQPSCNLTTNLSEKPSYRQKPYPGRRVAPKLECPPPRYKRDWKKVLCFLPVYLPSGQNGCRICYSDDTWEDIPHRLEWVLEDWSRHHLTSIPLLQRQSAQWLGKLHSRRLPLVINHNVCLIPVKYRMAKRRNDTVSGYLTLQKIQHLSAQPNGNTTISFYHCSCHLTTPEQYSTLLENINLGWHLLQCFEKTH